MLLTLPKSSAYQMPNGHGEIRRGLRHQNTTHLNYKAPGMIGCQPFRTIQNEGKEA
jgi:hypothetical protein